MVTGGEFELINRLREVLGPPPDGVYRSIGDDAAVLVPPVNKLLFSCDMLVEGVHFRLDFSTPFELGWKALAVNVSDMAAMAGTPRYALVALGVSAADRPFSFYEEIYRGLAGAARRYGVAVVGGDTVRTRGPLVIDVAIMGEADRPIMRCGGRPGDLIAVTGSLGASTAGLEWFLRHRRRLGSPPVERAVLAHQMPEARVREARAAAATGGVTSMIDISDGLAGDLGHLCEQSGAGAVLDAGAIPLDEDAVELARQLGANPMEWALHGGEDYELLMTVAADRAPAVGEAVATCGTSFHLIGRMTAGETGITLRFADRTVPVTRGGYTHF